MKTIYSIRGPGALVLACSAGWLLGGCGGGGNAPVDPNGRFTSAVAVSGLSQPTDMAFAPDGRIFISEKAGALKTAAPGSATASNALQLSVYTGGENGLLGLALDPQFASNGLIYLFYTANAGSLNPPPSPANRVSRFTVSGSSVLPGSEQILLDRQIITGGNHSAGCLQFGPDGKLYVSTGDAGASANSQDLGNLNGKILRLNPDGTVPNDNPFFGQAGRRPEIYCYGLRNPFKFSFRPGTNLLYIGDVGQSSWEEINVGLPGGNYGWPLHEGPGSSAGTLLPAYSYPTGANAGTVIAGVFLTGANYPAEYRGDFYFGDFMRSELHRLDVTANNTVSSSARFGPSEGLGDIANSVVDIAQGTDGDLYVLSFLRGDATRIEFR